MVAVGKFIASTIALAGAPKAPMISTGVSGLGPVSFLRHTDDHAILRHNNGMNRVAMNGDNHTVNVSAKDVNLMSMIAPKQDVAAQMETVAASAATGGLNL